MSNIEEDIKVNNKYIYIKEVAQKVVNRYKEKYKGEKFLPEPSEQTCMAYEILNLLSERETDKKRIKELEEEILNKENKIWQLKETIQDLENECISLHELIDEEM